MNILILGAGGFIGSNLIEGILERNLDWKVTGVDISSKKIEEFLDKINYVKTENNFSLSINTDYSLINLDDIIFEENKSYLYLKPVKDETYEDIKLKYESAGYTCNYLTDEGNYEEE